MCGKVTISTLVTQTNNLKVKRNMKCSAMPLQVTVGKRIAMILIPHVNELNK